MIVPQSTVEKPLTVIDYIVGLAPLQSLKIVADYASSCPLEVRQDERFTKAVAARLAAIKMSQR